MLTLQIICCGPQFWVSWVSYYGRMIRWCTICHSFWHGVWVWNRAPLNTLLKEKPASTSLSSVPVLAPMVRKQRSIPMPAESATLCEEECGVCKHTEDFHYFWYCSPKTLLGWMARHKNQIRNDCRKWESNLNFLITGLNHKLFEHSLLLVKHWLITLLLADCI